MDCDAGEIPLEGNRQNKTDSRWRNRLRERRYGRQAITLSRKRAAGARRATRFDVPASDSITNSSLVALSAVWGNLPRGRPWNIVARNRSWPNPGRERTQQTTHIRPYGRPGNGRSPLGPPAPTDQKRSAILTSSACASFSILSMEMLRAPRSTCARKDLSKAQRAASSSCDQPRSARRRRKLDASCCLAEIDGELGAETDIRAMLGFGCFSVSSF